MINYCWLESWSTIADWKNDQLLLIGKMINDCWLERWSTVADWKDDQLLLIGKMINYCWLERWSTIADWKDDQLLLIGNMINYCWLERWSTIADWKDDQLLLIGKMINYCWLMIEFANFLKNSLATKAISNYFCLKSSTGPDLDLAHVKRRPLKNDRKPKTYKFHSEPRVRNMPAIYLSIYLSIYCEVPCWILDVEKPCFGYLFARKPASCGTTVATQELTANHSWQGWAIPNLRFLQAAIGYWLTMVDHEQNSAAWIQKSMYEIVWVYKSI